MDRTCNECGSTEWTEVHTNSYPERRRERERTLQHIYICANCRATARHYEHQHQGTETFSGAWR